MNKSKSTELGLLRFLFFLSTSQATDRAMGMNGLDVAGLRPFDLVIPFTIQKGEITGCCFFFFVVLFKYINVVLFLALACKIILGIGLKCLCLVIFR